jgi:dipeptidyl-peptidase-4
MKAFVFCVCVLAWTAQAAVNLQSFSLSRSGKYVARQDADGSAWVIEASSGSKKLLGKEVGKTVSFAWAAGDKSVFVTRDGKISGYAVNSGRVLAGFVGSSPASLVDASPDGHNLSFIRDDNLWIFSLERKAAKPLTQAGSSNLLIGTPELVYGREFNVSRHYWWAPDSSSIAFIETQFADANHYVLPGAKLPVFRLKTIDVATGHEQLISESTEQWPYILRVAWHPDSRRIVFYRMNRLQNTAELCVYEDGALETVLTEKDAYWLNAPETPEFVAGGKQIVISSERSGAKHVYLYDLGGQLVRDLTPAGLEVYGLHQTSDPKYVYVSGSNGTKQEQQLYRLNLDGSAVSQLTSTTGWHEVSLNASGSVYLDCHSSVIKPPSVEWHETGGKVREMETAGTDEKPVGNEFFTIRTHDHVELPARLFKPDDFDANKKYPMIVYTFSGPRGRVVTDSWGGWQMTWNRGMVRKGYLVLALDVRGSGGYGHLFEEYIHYRFGAQETADLREAVAYLRRQSYVDGSRLGIWGCDYGAHTVVHAMWEFPGGFKAGFADSPIAVWRNYDAYFTERYLGLPRKRFVEYDDSTALDSAFRMTGTLLVEANPNDPIIRSDQVEAMQAVMKRKRNKDVAKRFQVVNLPEDKATLMQQMTEFFRQTL